VSDDAARRQRVDAICHAALDVPGAARGAFVREACGGDDELSREVDALLAHAPAIDRFLDERLDAVAAGVVTNMPDGNAPNGATGGSNRAARSGALTGQRLNAFEIGLLLGVGGMGEVYRARDTELRRDVALKVLPPGVTRDADRLARFEREARMLASLNHPNIAAIYGVVRAEGVVALILELVEGQTLADRIAAKARGSRKPALGSTASGPASAGAPRPEALKRPDHFGGHRQSARLRSGEGGRPR
jgi:hypothetical protein